ncbi:MAG: MBL fold metallo-hydrolase [Candidatus Eisenbacteria bacterium]|nr:MBL fold metallo-hydrolase [Candidatus Eisenbacteria bacterium]
MRITWLGHASFLIETADGTRVITDPFEAGSYEGAVGYEPICERADIVTVSHEHADHNAVGCVTGGPEIVREAGERTVRGVTVRGVPSYHDDSRGRERGANTMFVIEADGLRVAHLGDLGHQLSADEAKAVGRVDVLLAPVGGHFTIGPEDAKRVVERLGARVVIPMHYKTDVLGFPIRPVDDFLKLMGRVERPGRRSLEVRSEDTAGETKVVVLDYC